MLTLLTTPCLRILAPKEISHLILGRSEEGAAPLSLSHPRFSVKCPPLLRTLTYSMSHILCVLLDSEEREGTGSCQHSSYQPRSQRKWVGNTLYNVPSKENDKNSLVFVSLSWGIWPLWPPGIGNYWGEPGMCSSGVLAPSYSSRVEPCGKLRWNCKMSPTFSRTQK